MLTSLQVLAVVHAIYITEGSNHTAYQYGIKHHYESTTARQACINTVKHFVSNHPAYTLNASFVAALSNVYCPVTADPVGNKNWQHNMVKILHL